MRNYLGTSEPATDHTLERTLRMSFSSLKTVCTCVQSHLSCVQLFEHLWNVAYQAPLSMGIFQARILHVFERSSVIFALPGRVQRRRWSHMAQSPCGSVFFARGCFVLAANTGFEVHCQIFTWHPLLIT